MILILFMAKSAYFCPQRYKELAETPKLWPKEILNIGIIGNSEYSDYSDIIKTGRDRATRDAKLSVPNRDRATGEMK